MFNDPYEVTAVVLMCLLAYLWGVVAATMDAARRRRRGR